MSKILLFLHTYSYCKCKKTYRTAAGFETGLKNTIHNTRIVEIHNKNSIGAVPKITNAKHKQEN
jgi:hypothetical protein